MSSNTESSDDIPLAKMAKPANESQPSPKRSSASSSSAKNNNNFTNPLSKAKAKPFAPKSMKFGAKAALDMDDSEFDTVPCLEPDANSRPGRQLLKGMGGMSMGGRVGGRKRLFGGMHMRDCLCCDDKMVNQKAKNRAMRGMENM